MNTAKIRLGTWILIFGIFLSTGCTTSTSVSSPPTQTPKAQAEAAPALPPVVQPDPEAVRRALLGADLAFSRLSEESGAPEAFYQFMAPEAICLFAGELPIQGRDTIKVHLAARPHEVLAWKPREAEAGTDGAIGYTWGMYEARGPNQEGQPRTSYGKYVILWKKQADNSWKANLYATSPSPAPGRR